MLEWLFNAFWYYRYCGLRCRQWLLGKRFTEPISVLFK